MSVEQLRGFIRSSKQLKHSDKQVSDYLKNIKLTQRLTPDAIVELQAEGAGPRTVEALKVIAAASSSLEAPKTVAAVAKPPAAIIPPPSAAEQNKLLEEMQEYARSYSRRLPDFICMQVTRRFEDPSGLEFWQRLDVITAKLTFFEGKEDYKVVLINNHYLDTTLDKIGGTTSRGEFGTMLNEIFDPASGARFKWERWATLRGKRMHVFSFAIPQSKSKFLVNYRDEQWLLAAYKGFLYLDRDTGAVMRITQEIDGLPPSFPLQQITSTIDYDTIEIAGAKYVLPIKAVNRSREGKKLQKNEIEFRMYNKFGVEANITFEPEPLPEELTQEQPAQTSPAAPTTAPSTQ